MNNQPFDDEVIEILAEAIHEIFYESLYSQGYKYAPVTNDENREDSSLITYKELFEYEKELNREIVRDIPYKLAALGYSLKTAQNVSSLTVFKKDEIEKLSIMEHERWMNQKIASGWKWAKKTDKSRKLHKDMVGWAKLTEKEKNKDRILIKSIPDLLSRVGYTLVKKVD